MNLANMTNREKTLLREGAYKVADALPRIQEARESLLRRGADDDAQQLTDIINRIYESPLVELWQKL
jgi:hypothetical protein